MEEQYFKHTPQAVSERNQVENLAIEVEEAFLKVENTLWSDQNNSASISSSIGNLDPWYLKEYSPDNGIKLNYTQDLYFPQYSKEASLDLTPDTTVALLNSAVIKNRLNPSQVYTYKHDGKLESDTDFCFVGRKVILGKSPSSSKALTISYAGYEPLDTLEEGLDLKYNVLQVKVGDEIQKEFSTTVENGLYKISGYNFKSMCTESMIDIINNRPYNLEKYVVIYSAENGERYDVTDINITDSYISFESEADIQGLVKVYIANSNLSELVEGVYRLFYSHNHGNDGGKLVNHKDLTGLYNNTDKLSYSVTNKENYDHPQYLNREGYIESPEVYNNALVGDLLVASTDEANYYNNLSKDSYKIIFGEYASGHRIGYSNDADVLVIDSLSRDGIKLVSPKDSNILSLNSHVFTDKLDGDFSGVQLAIAPTIVGTKEVSVFSIKKLVEAGSGAVQEDSAELHVYSSTFSISKVKDTLQLLDAAVISFGTTPGVQISKTPEGILMRDVTQLGDQNFTIALPVVMNTAIVEHLDATNIHLTGKQRIVFSDSTHADTIQKQHLAFNDTNDQLELTLNKPLLLKQNGLSSGLALTETNKIFASNSQGTNTTNSAEKLDTYVQTNGSVFFIEYNANNTVGNAALQSAKRADVFANTATVSNISINYLENSTNALRLNGDTHKVFVQKDSLGNTATHLQSSGGVNVVSNYSVTGSTVNITYGTIRAAEFRAEGSGDTSGFYGNIIVPTGSKLTVNGSAFINSELELTNNLTVKGISKLNTLETNSVKATNITASESLVTPLITAPLGYDSLLYFGSDVLFNNSVEFKQVCTFTSNCHFNSTIRADTVIADKLTVYSDVSFPKVTATDIVAENSLHFKRMLQTDYTMTSEFAGPLLLNNGLIMDRGTAIRLGSSDITSTRNTSGVLVTENAIKMGNNSTIRATKMFANKGIPTGGNSDIIGGYSFDTALSATDGDTGLFCTDKGTSALVDDLVFYINGEKKGEIPFETLNLSGSIAGKEKTLVTAEMIKNQFDKMNSNVLGMVYPVGSVYINATDNRNPKEVLNWPTSVWARFAMGMTLVGAEGTASSEQMSAMWNKPSNISLTIEKEFGEFEHQITIEESAEHWHGFPGDDHLTAFGIQQYKSQPVYDADSTHTNRYSSGWYPTTSVGGNKPHNNVQPSVVVAMWRRIG